MKLIARIAATLLALALPGAAAAGTYVFAGQGGEDIIVHPTGYTGTGGVLVVTVPPSIVCGPEAKGA